MELADNDGRLTFVDDDGKHVYHTKLKPRRGNDRLGPLTQEHTALLKDFFLNSKNTDIVSEFWRWFFPTRFR